MIHIDDGLHALERGDRTVRTELKAYQKATKKVAATSNKKIETVWLSFRAKH